MESASKETLQDILKTHFGKLVTNLERLVGYEDLNFLLTVTDTNSDVVEFGHDESNCKRLILKITTAPLHRLGM